MSRIRRLAHRAARASAAAAPHAVREVALALATRSADGPTLLPGPPEGPVLVLAPHPDDETIGAGGTIARHAARGDEVVVVVATSGEATTGGRIRHGSGRLAAAREAECRAACVDLGVTMAPVFCRLPDGRLGEAVDELAGALAEQGAHASVVYAPTVLDPHRDHRAANAALVRAGLRAEVLGYEVWSPAPVDVLVDVGEVWADKERALRRYATALASVDYVRAAAGLAAYRSASCGLGGVGWAEGFVRLDPATHAELVTRAGLLAWTGDGGPAGPST
ncbi:hypothetical protein BH20ACT8_BH20ACT8_21700 [soil metagenome]